MALSAVINTEGLTLMPTVSPVRLCTFKVSPSSETIWPRIRCGLAAEVCASVTVPKEMVASTAASRMGVVVDGACIDRFILMAELTWNRGLLYFS
jgi:hypothetical protein